MAEEGVTLEMLGERKPHYKSRRWPSEIALNEVVMEIIPDQREGEGEPVERFNEDSIQLPEDNEDGEDEYRF